MTPGTSMHYQVDVQGTTSPAQVCLQNVLPNQPPGSCVVTFTSSDKNSCYQGFTSVVTFDSNLQSLIGSAPAPANPAGNAKVIGPAVAASVVGLVAIVACECLK